jgi:SAM-dependent methyltransferase
VKEAEIRPAELLKRYLALSEQDAKRCFENSDLTQINCFACESTDHESVISKNGFLFSLCNSCGTLFQSPRPSREDFSKFYRDSESNEYWSNVFFPAVAEARREKILAPRAASLSKACDKLGIEVSRIADVGAGHGILLEEWGKLNPETSLVAIEPSRSMADTCRRKGFEVIEDVVENVQANVVGADLVASFEVFEHVHDPYEFVRSLSKIAGIGKHVFISTLCVDGFDIQVLWDKSNSVFPPHHLNFASIEGFRTLFERAGLEIVEITTPGVLDVDIVRNFVHENSEDVQLERFIKKILMDDALSQKFQSFLSENLLSSHVWIFAKVVE